MTQAYTCETLTMIKTVKRFIMASFLCPLWSHPLSCHPFSKSPLITDLLSIIKDEFIFSRIFSGFFHWELFWGSFTLLYVFRAHSFDCWVIYHCIDIPQLVYSFTNWWWIWVVYSFWLFPIKLLWIFVYKSLNKHIFPFLLGNYLGVEWLDHVVGVCLIFKGTPKLFSKVVVPFYTLVSVQCVSSCSSRPYQHLI